MTTTMVIWSMMIIDDDDHHRHALLSAHDRTQGEGGSQRNQRDDMEVD